MISVLSKENSFLFSFFGTGKKRKKSASVTSIPPLSPSTVDIQRVDDVEPSIELPGSSSTIPKISSDDPTTSHKDQLPTQFEKQAEVIEGTVGKQFFENMQTPCQPHLQTYPRRLMSGKKRFFNPDWFRHNWLEYNQELDACFCFACRVFMPQSKEKAFTKTGYSDWKHALESGKGLNKHQECPSHNSAMCLWEDHKKRETSHVTIKDSIVATTSDQKQWLFNVFNVIRYLSSNGLPLRGDTESDIESGDGLFLRAFSQLLFPLDPKLKEIHKRLPMNAKYTSHGIQNEVIVILTTLVRQNIADEVKEAKLFTIMADGTTDKNRKEVQGLVCRYLTSSGEIAEHCLNIKGVEDRSAQGIFDFIKETLIEYDIGTDGVVSQSYDGASVMSGEYGGLQALISGFCKRNILYVHCFLHRINLVVVHVMENIPQIKEYFDIISTLYNFFKKAAVSESYDGTQLKRLIATRWSGHFDSTSHVYTNYSDIIKALTVASTNKKLKSEEKAIASGLIDQMEGGAQNGIFVFVNCMLMEILKPLNIVVKTLQSKSENLSTAVEVVSAVREELISTRNEVDADKIDDMISKFKEANEISPVRSNQTRKRSVPSRYDDFVITEHLPGENSAYIEIFKECLDLIESEFKRRFSSDNIVLWQAMESLSPNSEKFLDWDTLLPLFEYAKTIPQVMKHYSQLKLSVEDIKAECRVFSRVLKSKEWPKTPKGDIDLVQVASIVIREYEDSAPVTSSLFKVAVTAGFTSTRVECLFSALTRVDTPQRRSMKTERECNLAYLAFERKTLLEKITFEDFIHAWKLSPRKVLDF